MIETCNMKSNKADRISILMKLSERGQQPSPRRQHLQLDHGCAVPHSNIRTMRRPISSIRYQDDIH